MNSRQTQDCRLDSLPLWRRNRQATARYFILFLFLSIALVGISGSLWAQNEGNPEFAYTATGSCSCEGQGSIPGSVSAYTIDGATGVLTQISGSPFPAGQNSHSVVADRTGQFLYVANHDSNNVSAYTIDPSSGALTPITGSPFSAGAGPHAVTVDPTGQFSYVANHLSNDVSAYTIDAASGALTPISGSPFPAGEGSPFSNS